MIDPFDPRQAPVRRSVLRSDLSPRLGIAHPIREDAVVYGNFGVYMQPPDYRNTYIVGSMQDAVPLFGNPNMEAEKTVAYEFGYRQRVTEALDAEAVVWTKDVSRLVSSETVPIFLEDAADRLEYTVFLNYDYAQSRGFDLTLTRRFRDHWRARLDYSFMTTQANRDDPWWGYRSGDELETMPKRPRVLGWDQPHRGSADISVSLPEGTGPGILGLRPLERSSASIVFRAASGRPYTPSTKDWRILEPNSGRRPWTFQWDLRCYRDFDLFGVGCSLFADVRNLFDRRNVFAVFSRTGKPDDPGPAATSFTDAYDAWHYFSTPRTVNLGLRVNL